MPVIEGLTAREILDSRGRPTVLATCQLASGEPVSASVPSGSSTGEAEAHELRDGDPHRYRGLGCQKAVANINGEIHRALAGQTFLNQSELDGALTELDATPNKSRLGSNAILAVSIAFARSVAAQARIPLWQYLSQLTGTEAHLPRLTINLFSGGRHAGSQVSIQDVLVVPIRATSIDESLAMTYNVYHAAAELALDRYQMRLLRADEGGLAPPFRSSEEMIQAALTSIERAGYTPGEHFSLAVDVASSEFYSEDGIYTLDHETLTSGQMIERIKSWINRYPIISIEDGLAETDWRHWPNLTAAIGAKALSMGDDLLCTNPERIQRAVGASAANALLLKVNQIGTLTEAVEAYRLARSAGWSITVSVRSGETEDNWAADLVVGWNGDYFKNGSITQSERLSKYNRLLEIESATGWKIPQQRETK